MLVQMSPWTTALTSIKAPNSSRRRKRADSNDESCPYDASFVITSSRKVQQKWKQQSSEFAESQPLLAITTGHRISVIGRSKDLSCNEFSSLQYSSRPGTTGSFLPIPGIGKPSSNLPKIPAILDAKNEWVYSVCNGNRRLACWEALHGNGPDEKNSIRFDLAKPAISMSLLPMHKGVVYGSCVDGTIFVARLSNCDNGRKEIAVDYIPSKVKKLDTHLGTFAELPQGQVKTSGRKRKMSDVDGHTTVIFYQALQIESVVKFVRHELQFERFASASKMIVEGSLGQQEASITLASESAEEKVTFCQLLVSSTGSSPKASIVYRIKTTRGESNHEACFSSLVSLLTGDISHTRVPLAATTNQYGMITETLFAAASHEEIVIYDLETGSVLQKCGIPGYVGRSFVMCTDAKFATMAILYTKDDNIAIDFSSMLLDESVDSALTTGLTLSSKLASSIVGIQPENSSFPMVVESLIKLDDSNPGEVPFKKMIEMELASMDEARVSILSSKEQKEDYIFMDTYESSVATLLTALKNSHSENGAIDEQQNPQDDLQESTNEKQEASKQNSRKAIKTGLNGLHTSGLSHVRAITPSILPQAFIDGAMAIALKLLQSAEGKETTHSCRLMMACLDARMILCRLLSTGKVSARHHFDGNETIQESSDENKLTAVLHSVELNNKRGRRCYTPVMMIHDMLQKCPDISERQMVAMISYMMRSSLPEDIAEFFQEDRSAGINHKFKKLSRQFFLLRAKVNKSSSKDKSLNDRLDRLSQKLIISGTGFVLLRILCYSETNEAMLRAALQDLIDENESILLAKILSSLLSSTSETIVSRATPSHSVIKATCQWVSALCDSFRDELSVATVGGGAQSTTYLTHLLRSVQLATKQSKRLISLREDVRRAEADIEMSVQQSKMYSSPGLVLASSEDVPGYSVDQLMI